jgi:hypothetical protein
MSRWYVTSSVPAESNRLETNPKQNPRLVNYTPQATIVRLLTIAATNTYLTSCALWVTGGLADPRLLLPVWIAISTVHMPYVTQMRKKPEHNH